MTAKADKNPLSHFGRQVRRERVARGWSLDEMARRTGLAAPYWSQIENGRRPPTLKVAQACDRVFPERKNYFLEYYEESKSWTPPGFRDWPEYEDRAVSLRAWSPGVLHGLLQTESYARTLLSTVPAVTDDMVTARLASRMERQQRVLYRDDPPEASLLVDELSLFREVGSAEIMTEQLRHLASVALMPNVTMQILPAVAHPANASEFIVTESAAYVEHLGGGLVYAETETVASYMRLFTKINAESYRASESLRMIERLGELWTGGNLLSALLKEDRA